MRTTLIVCAAIGTAALVATPLFATNMAAPAPVPPNATTAIFAGGCFWCIEKDFEALEGVYEVESGYINGKNDNPTYEQVSAGSTGHAEAVRVIYDPARVSYPQLVEYFWRQIDPVNKNGQFCDIGSQYRSGIYWQNDEERAVATASRDALAQSGKVPVIHTELAPAGTFWMAEEYHQDYYKKNPVRYNYYRASCGRDTRLRYLWGEK